MYQNRIPVIILNYNSSADCAKCVAFLQQQTDIELEIIIVDNSSQVEDLHSLEDLCSKESLTLLRNDVNKGYSAGNNIGLRYASEKGYEFALILNPDMELHQRNYISTLATYMLNDPLIAVAGSDIVSLEGEHQNPMREASFNEELFWFIELFKRKVTGKYSFKQDHQKSGYCEKLSGCCFMIRISFLIEINFLDENTFLYCEEPILAKQIQAQNMKTYYSSEIQAVHMHIKSAKGNQRKRLNLFFKSRRYYLLNYSGYPTYKKYLILFSYKSQQSLSNILTKS